MAQYRVAHFRWILFAALFASLSFGCTTTGNFVVPAGTELEVYSRPVVVESDGTATMSPFFWNAIGGVPYRLLRSGGVVKEGKLRAVFRPVSIFWPPAALIYWPVGLNPTLTYDLVNDTQQ